MFKILLNIFLLTVVSLPSYAVDQDPTRPAYPINTPETAEISIEAEPRLSAIWSSEHSRWATINGVQAKQGQSIPGNIKIIKIRKNAVTINQNGNIKTLQLLQRPYKTTK
ncbi:MAG: general secretion pathway protein GspB [Methylococcaceae bacterium]|nr:general secretion pathway protein GspB [Methylococcaceae bacterium]MDP2394978.1 general secretion pathway protein GspB [Methylococcaceae bacterium]MDP3019504.1 general secretion pathway protein GspB [Methylococcaceae bacterium]MDP3389494.1 general secretion pathway protein GspB [Methylococcaceae bacterium]MDP3932361.1 general secretion pathway protein GspB [Methylococcaceae bacterium]